MGRRSYYSVKKRAKDLRQKEKAERKMQRRQNRRDPSVPTSAVDIDSDSGPTEIDSDMLQHQDDDSSDPEDPKQ